MLREAFDPERYIPAAALDHWVVTLEVRGSALDLRTDDTLDALGLDDQINTSRAPDVWQTAHTLADLHWNQHAGREHLPAILYRSRTTPQHNANIVLFQTTAATVTNAEPLHRRTDLLQAAITVDGFTIEM